MTPYQGLFLLYAALLLPALFLLFRIPGEAEAGARGGDDVLILSADRGAAGPGV